MASMKPRACPDCGKVFTDTMNYGRHLAMRPKWCKIAERRC